MDQSAERAARTRAGYASGHYWTKRSDYVYYRCVDYVVRVVGAEARSLVDVGTGNCPYMEWFDWIPERVSLDLRAPYRSPAVRGIEADLMEHPFEERFDLCTCLQVLEHVPDAAPFARRLLQIARCVVVSVPHRWPRNDTAGHVHDPVTERKLARWMGRWPNHVVVVAEPFRTSKAERLVAVFHEDPGRRFGPAEIERRHLREAAV